jgi:hypothetical protein
VTAGLLLLRTHSQYHAAAETAPAVLLYVLCVLHHCVVQICHQRTHCCCCLCDPQHHPASRVLMT